MNEIPNEVTLENVIINEKKNVPMIVVRGLVVLPYSTINLELKNEKTSKALRYGIELNKEIFFVTSKKIEENLDGSIDVYELGVLAKVKRVINVSGNSSKLTLDGGVRAKFLSCTQTTGFYMAEVEVLNDEFEDEIMIESSTNYLKLETEKYLNADLKFEANRPLSILGIEDHNEFLYTIASMMSLTVNYKQEILKTDIYSKRAELVAKAIVEQTEIAYLQKSIAKRVKDSVEKGQKEFYLREQLKAIHQELGDDVNELDELTEKIKNKNLPKEIEEKSIAEIGRLRKMNPSSPEATVIRTYLDWILDLPWGTYSKDNEDILECKKILDADHFGLEKVKERIVEYLAVHKLTKTFKGSIICFVGPPGVGKTSIASSIARAMGREFVRMSLGGVKDEAEIRGHRRTYIGAMPGRIIYGLKSAKTSNPVFLLDEIDKLSSDLRGDPASALLEVLDPEQNATFRDRFLEVPYDLSNVMFITTANSLKTISAPLLDRMDVIELSGYTELEKIEIAKRYLIPKKCKESGIKEENISIMTDAITKIIREHALESGVRNLEKNIGTLCRKVATKISETDNLDLNEIITEKNLDDYLGIGGHSTFDRNYKNEVGSVTGLAWTAVGGATLVVEVALMKGKGEIIITGNLGDVMKESARAALTVIRARADKYGIDYKVFAETDVHIHVPEGATPKDGPSAGVTLVTALLSAFTNKPVRCDVAMTGEITLCGKVMAIGGLKEKVLAGKRAGITTIILPKENEKDLKDITNNITEGMNFVLAEDIETVIENSIVK